MTHEPSTLQASNQAADESFGETPVGAGPQPCPKQPLVAPAAVSWIEIELIGQDDQPLVGERYRVELGDGSAIEGRIGPTGIVRVEGIDPANCMVTFPELDGTAWERV
jgi:hypothetical protein